jgi:hypothetical protein
LISPLTLRTTRNHPRAKILISISLLPIVCPLVYTRNQTNAARVPGSVLFTVQCIPAASSNPSNVGNMQANLANMQDDLDHPLRPRQPEPLPPTLSQLWHVWVCDTSFLVDYGLSQSSTQTIMNQKWIDCCPRHPNQLETRSERGRSSDADLRASCMGKSELLGYLPALLGLLHREKQRKNDNFLQWNRTKKYSRRTL